jgi:metal-sulfur cluster biosynthetic enzyme
MADPHRRMSAAPPQYRYAGPRSLAATIDAALRRVVDPEMGLDIVGLGLVYGVEASAPQVKVALTMTSAACPVAELIIDDIVAEVADALGNGADVRCELVWEPPWTPERMSPAARSAMGWD